MSKEEIAVHFVTELIRTGALGLPKSVVNAYHEILEGLSEEECENFLRTQNLCGSQQGNGGPY